MKRIRFIIMLIIVFFGGMMIGGIVLDLMVKFAEYTASLMHNLIK